MPVGVWSWGEKVKRAIRAGSRALRRSPSCHDRTRLAGHTDALTRDAHTNPNPNPNAHSNGAPVRSPPVTDPRMVQKGLSIECRGVGPGVDLTPGLSGIHEFCYDIR